MPQNVSEIASMISMLRGFLSDKTLMQLVPNVEDPQEELARREAEEQDAMKNMVQEIMET